MARLLTRKRITLQAAVLAIALWSGYAVNMASPGFRDRAGNFKGGDFLHFYTAAQLLRAERAIDLYNPTAHARFQKALLPQSAGTYFVPMYGPQFYLLLEPISAFPYLWAVLVWGVLNSVLYFGSCYVLLRTCSYLGSESRLVFLLAAANPAFFSLIAFGQSSAPALVLFALAFLALQGRRPFMAGLAIGSLVYKPQLGLAAAIILLCASERRVISGAITAAVGQVGFAWAYFGSAVMKRYGQTLLEFRNAEPFLEPKLYQMHSLRSFWSLLLPWRSAAAGLYVISSIAVLALSVTLWKKGKDLRWDYAGLLLCTILISPHLWIYDLVILVPAFLLLSEWVLEQPGKETTIRTRVLLYACYVLPLLGPVARFTRIQVSVIAFAVTLTFLWRESQRVSLRQG